MAGLDHNTPIPSEIKLHQKSNLLELAYENGERFELSCEFLRVFTPSAEARGHGPGQETLQIGKRDVRIERIERIQRAVDVGLIRVAGIAVGLANQGLCRHMDDDIRAGFRDGTTNRFCAAPVQLCRRHLELGSEIRALVINTGIANAGTGEPGVQAAWQTCSGVGKLLGIEERQVLPFSTGVILEPLPVERLLGGLPACADDLKADNWHAAAHAIMTTDTVAKAASRRVDIGGKTVTITGISKGAGMIKPNMATMLGFMATDAGIAAPLLRQLVREAADESFNCITVDGDTSTNDSFILIASGQSGVEFADASAAGYAQLRAAVIAVAVELAQAIIRDGETIGMAVRTKERTKPVYVSVGNRIDLFQAVDLVLATARGYRLPEPTRQAHLFANLARKTGIGEDRQTGLPSPEARREG